MNFRNILFAAAATNAVPAITFIMAVLIRMESISIKRVYGLAMILGSVLSLAGAITFALVKGPHLGFMKWYQENHNHTSHPLTIVHSKGDTIRGSLLMLLSSPSSTGTGILFVYLSLNQPDLLSIIGLILLDLHASSYVKKQFQVIVATSYPWRNIEAITEMKQMGNCSMKGTTGECHHSIRVMCDSGAILQLKAPKTVAQVLQHYPSYVEHQKSCCDKVQQVVQRSEEMCKSAACHYVENLSNGSALEVLPTAKNGVWRVKLLIDLRLGNCLWLEWKTRVLVRSHCQISTNKSN
ncbi:hypothetical protein JHK82_043691 [Glycine max]|nr:hypothetical protein JHK82_043691 [Glycine max]